MLSNDEAFGLTERKKREWCLLSVSYDGHPTYGCPGCWSRVTVRRPGAKLPSCCAQCKRPLTAPVVRSFMARRLLTQGGHEDLLGDATLPED